MSFWIGFDHDLVGARSENGFIHPDAVESGLDRIGIQIEENRDAAKRMLFYLAAGRNQGSNDKIEPEKTKHG